MITKQMIRSEEAICTYIRKADQSMAALGFTEHSFAHVTKVAEFAQRLLLELGYPERTGEMEVSMVSVSVTAFCCASNSVLESTTAKFTLA